MVSGSCHKIAINILLLFNFARHREQRHTRTLQITSLQGNTALRIILQVERRGLAPLNGHTLGGQGDDSVKAISQHCAYRSQKDIHSLFREFVVKSHIRPQHLLANQIADLCKRFELQRFEYSLYTDKLIICHHLDAASANDAGGRIPAYQVE